MEALNAAPGRNQLGTERGCVCTLHEVSPHCPHFLMIANGFGPGDKGEAGRPEGASSHVVQVRAAPQSEPPGRATPAGKQPGLPLSGFTVRDFSGPSQGRERDCKFHRPLRTAARRLHCFLHRNTLCSLQIVLYFV